MCLTLVILSCSQEETKPEYEIHERLEQYINSSDKVGIVLSGELDFDSNTRLDSNSDQNVASEISFEVYNNSVLPEIEQIFDDYGNPTYDFSDFLEFRNSLLANFRINSGSCREYGHTLYSPMVSST